MDTYWKTEFRKAMKARRMTFAELAYRLQMSVPGTKKVFQKKDIGLERFNQICRILEVDPLELMRAANENVLKTKEIDPKVDQYLLREPKAFRLYWCLAVEKLPLKEALHETGLGRAQAYRYLRKLDSFGLLIWRENDEIVLPDRSHFFFDKNSASVREFLLSQSIRMTRDCFRSSGRGKRFFTFRYLGIPSERLPELESALTRTLNSFTLDHPYPGRKDAGKKGLQPTQILLCVAQEMVSSDGGSFESL